MGYNPLNKKLEAINNLAPPRNCTEVQKFIGFVNYYRDMWKKCSEILASLTELTSAFDTMKKIMAKETLLAYPNFKIPFEIHTDASAYQLGACISQKGKPIAFYSRKLTPAQTRYTTTERNCYQLSKPSKNFIQSFWVNNSLFILIMKFDLQTFQLRLGNAMETVH